MCPSNYGNCSLTCNTCGFRWTNMELHKEGRAGAWSRFPFFHVNSRTQEAEKPN